MTNEQCIALGKVLKVFGDKIQSIRFGSGDVGLVRYSTGEQSSDTLWIERDGTITQSQKVQLFLDGIRFLISLTRISQENGS